MEKWLNDPDCAQIDGELKAVSVSAESHGLTLEFTFQFSRHFTFDFTFGFTFQSNAAVLWGEWEWEREKGRWERGADLSARWRTQRVELEWVGGL